MSKRTKNNTKIKTNAAMSTNVYDQKYALDICPLYTKHKYIVFNKASHNAIRLCISRTMLMSISFYYFYSLFHAVSLYLLAKYRPFCDTTYLYCNVQCLINSGV